MKKTNSFFLKAPKNAIYLTTRLAFSKLADKTIAQKKEIPSTISRDGIITHP